MAAESPFSEIVLGFVYPIGTNVDPLIAVFKNYLTQYGYKSHEYRISDHLQTLELDISFDDSSPFGKSDALIKAGNAARQNAKDDQILAVMTVTEIASHREIDQEQQPMAAMRTAHIVRSFKRKEEVDLFRHIYKSGFYLIGIANDDDSQMVYLNRQLGIDRTKAQELIDRDQNEATPHGQRTRDTFHLADVFIESSEERYKDQIDRFLELLFGQPFITPTREEHAMFLAYASAARSAQLGRQVGAAIATAEGDVLAVGMNEVPSKRGGLYWGEDEEDYRDHRLNADPNSEHKSTIAKSIVANLNNQIVSVSAIIQLVNELTGEAKEHLEDQEFSKIVAQKLRERGPILDEELAVAAIKSSDLRSITEYGRAVHGEMDAILTCARLGISVRGRYLYVTTFPCHNCTRHIIASGIRRVYYIEPYPKSKAHDLHSDAICFNEDESKSTGKIPFLPFIGIGPRRYLDFFSLELSSGRSITRKDKQERPNLLPRTERSPRVPLIPASFLEREERLMRDYKDVLKALQGKPS